MELNDFISKFAETIEAETLIEANTNYREIEEWSSLSGLMVMGMIDDEYNVTINGNILKELNTVKELFDKVVELTNE